MPAVLQHRFESELHARGYLQDFFGWHNQDTDALADRAPLTKRVAPRPSELG